jgi:hypothetical protein
MAGKRSTDTVIEARVAEVAGMLSRVGRAEILAVCRKKYGVSERTADDYVARAREAVAEAFKRDIATEAGIAKARFESLFHAAAAKEDFHAAISAQRELCKLMGLTALDDQPGDLNVTVRIGGDA